MPGDREAVEIRDYLIVILNTTGLSDLTFPVLISRPFSVRRHFGVSSNPNTSTQSIMPWNFGRQEASCSASDFIVIHPSSG